MSSITPPLSWVDTVRAIHDCPSNNETCITLYYIAFALEADLTWPVCLLCKRCLVEPEVWKFPLAPMFQLLCAPCLIGAADPPISYMAFASEEYCRKTWLIKEIASGRDIRPFPGDGPVKRPYIGPKSESFFLKIKAAVPIEALAVRFTELRPAGPGRLKGLCPLHQESTPSFYIWTEKGTWRCFGACAEGGDVIKLATLRFALTPKEAAFHLAREFRVDLPIKRSSKAWRDRRGHLHLPPIEVGI